LYFAVFLELVFKMTDFNKIVILVILEIVSASSAYIIGKMGDRRGIKGLLIVSAINLSLVYFVVALLPSAGWIIYVLGGFIGMGYGGFYATTRALLVKISPAQRLGEYFGFYTTFQRFASIIGPLTWGIVVFAFGSYGLVRYRIAIIFLVLMMFAGTIILTRVKETQTLRPA
jgi:UMF1 family MFS transporter